MEFGKFLSVGCTGCHGDGLSGGPIPGITPDFPKATNITPDKETGIGTWTEDDFYIAINTGKRPDGSDIDPFMPWKNMRSMTTTELKALWLFLQTVPAKKFGNR